MASVLAAILVLLLLLLHVLLVLLVLVLVLVMCLSLRLSAQTESDSLFKSNTTQHKSDVDGRTTEKNTTWFIMKEEW